MAASPVVEYFEGTLDPDGDEADDLVRSVHRLMGHADEVRRLRVRANADTVEDAERARRFGAEGIGLCRTEHMFLGERRQHVERLILAEDDEQRDAGAGGAAAAAAVGLPADPHRDGRAADHDPAARPAAARVPARHHRVVGARRSRRGARGAATRTTCGSCRPCTRCTSRTRCSGCAGSGSGWSCRGCSTCRSGPSRRPPPQLIKLGQATRSRRS